MTRTHPPPWLFALASLPYGFFNGLVVLALPYLLRRHGVPVARIAFTLSIMQAPAIWYFLWAPVVDLRFRRRTWVLLLAAASAVCAAAALALNAPTALGVVTALMVTGSIFNQPISSALGGLVASVMPEPLLNRTAGWGQTGALAGAAAAGALALWLSDRWTTSATAMLMAGLIAAPALTVLAVAEPRRPPGSVRERAAATWAEVVATFTRREVWVAVALFVSPAGAGALMALFPAVAVDYAASTNVVVWAVGVGSAATTAAGAFAGGFLCERFGRWRVYPAAGIAAASCALFAARGSLTPVTYVASAVLYAFVIGVSYAAFMALALELLGSTTAGSGTRFTLFIAATNVPLVYMTWIDGAAHARFGVRGMLVADGLANGVFGALLLAWVWARGR